MRSLLAVPLIFAGLALPSAAQSTSCTGLCLQQVSCPGGGTTTISGAVYAPNGTDPLPNIVVYIPNGTVDAFTPGVSCPVVGAPPSGDPLVGTTTNVDGTFTLTNVPVGSNIPLVIVSGRWRRQFTISTVTACTDNPATGLRFPRNQSEGDIPKIAIATGGADSVECVLHKMQMDDAEFTSASGSGRIHLFTASYAPGAQAADGKSGTEDTLMSDPAVLGNYDVLMLPCEGGEFTRPAAELKNLVNYTNLGGRVYASHYAYAWTYRNPPFDTVANWLGSGGSLNDGYATVDPTFPGGDTLSKWLQLVGATTTPGQMLVQTVRHDINGVNAPTQSWLKLNSNNAVMQFTWDTPVGGAAGTQCGRVLFNEYHVENPVINSTGRAYPTECTSGSMTAQEKLLEYSLFDLSGDGAGPTLTPATRDFGSEPLGFSTGVQYFTWKNNAAFPLSVNSASASNDFAVVSNSCGAVAAGASCTIGVNFTPSALGARTGTLTVSSSAKTLTAALTGTGVPALTTTTTSLTFGSADVGARLSQSFLVTNSAPAALTLAAPSATGDYSATSGCSGAISPGASCTITVVFKPTTTGTRTGSVSIAAVNSSIAGINISTTGNGVDFNIGMNTSSGTVIAGYKISTSTTSNAIAGFNAPVTLTCTTNAPGSDCTISPSGFTLSGATTSNVAITTTSQYTVVGYGGMGSGLLTLFAVGAGGLLWFRRRSAGPMLRVGLTVLMLASAGLLSTGCSGKLPALNATPTVPGDYTYTITATDGFLSHSTTYALHVTKQ